MLDIKSAVRGLPLLLFLLPLHTQAEVTVYCCDANAEAQYLQDLNALQSVTVDITNESFEGTAWDGTRVNLQETVTSQSITWGTNGSSPGDFVGIRTSTGGGDTHEGQYIVFAVDENNFHLTPDNITLTANGITLYGVGGWFTSSGGTEMSFTSNRGIIDFPGEQATVFDWTFLGFIDDSGFSTLLIETAEIVGDDIKTFFSDDFTIAAQDGAFPGESLQFSSVSYSAAESAGSAAITVTRSGGSSGALSIDYETTSEGTATAGQDYTATSGTLDFADGETSKQFTVQLLDDAAFEDDETVTLLLTGSNVGPINAATLTITDDDVQPIGMLEFSGSSYLVGEDGGSLTISVQRNNGSEGSGSVDYTVSDGTATSGSDYTASSGTLNFADGDISASFTIDILEDVLQEGTESIILSLSNALSVTLGDRDFAEVHIVDNEATPAMGSIQFSGSAYSVPEGTAAIEIPVVRISGSMGAVSVLCTTTDSSATAGSDYTATQTTIDFAAGETLQTCSVPITDDSGYENDESFLVSLSAPGGGAVLGTTSSANVTINSNDAAPAAGTIQFGLSKYEQLESASSATITVSRNGGSSGSVTVDYATSNDSATAGSDYASASGSLTLADGVTSSSFQVTILDDTTYEGDETLTLTLSNPGGGAVIGDVDSAVLTIQDDEPAPTSGIFAFSTDGFSANEFDGVVTIDVLRQGGSSGTALIDYATSDGSATAGSEYEVASGTLSFADGETSKSFTVSLLDDFDFEGTETINLDLSNPFGAVLGSPSSATISLEDDDDPPAGGALNFSAGNYTVDENGASITVNVTRSGGSTGAVTVDYAALDSSAVTSSDFVFATGTIAFADGESGSKSFAVQIIDDSLLEVDESIKLILTNVQGGAVLGAQSQALVTITDDEAQSASAILGFSANSLSVSEDSGTATITITRSVSTAGTLTVDLTASSSDATPGTDYNVTTGTLQFNAGETQKVISVQILDNTITDGNRTITFALGNITGTAVIDSNNGTLTLTIVDDESDSGGGSGGGGGGGGSLNPLFFILMLLVLVFNYNRARGVCRL
ncbi:MAG: Calx-beta domain-containing protein [Candidatus Thiodiazotropha sp.]